MIKFQNITTKIVDDDRNSIYFQWCSLTMDITQSKLKEKHQLIFVKFSLLNSLIFYDPSVKACLPADFILL